jgi:uncharacterized protein YndB with AHSA1/START domain
MHHFDLITEWHLDDPIESVWQVLTAIENWPLWARRETGRSAGTGGRQWPGGSPPDDLQGDFAIPADH